VQYIIKSYTMKSNLKYEITIIKLFKVTIRNNILIYILYIIIQLLYCIHNNLYNKSSKQMFFQREMYNYIINNKLI
jgi:hypothetical protein